MVDVFFFVAAIDVDELALDAVGTEEEGGGGGGLGEGDDALLVSCVTDVGEELVVDAGVTVLELEALVALRVLVVLPEFESA